MKPYKTLLKAASEEFIVNKSRFIGHGAPCETEEEALTFLGRSSTRTRTIIAMPTSSAQTWA